jgi:activator of HSP90 ATPase
MEPEESTSYSQAETLLKRQEHKLIHKTFISKFVLSVRNAGTKIEQRLREWPTNNWLNLRPFPGAAQSLILLGGVSQRTVTLVSCL